MIRDSFAQLPLRRFSLCLFQFLCLFLPAISMSLVIHNSTERRNSSHVFVSSRNPASLRRKIRQSRGIGGDHYLLCLRAPSSRRPPHVFLCFDKSSFHLPSLLRELKTGGGFSAPNEEKYYWKWALMVDVCLTRKNESLSSAPHFHHSSSSRLSLHRELFLFTPQNRRVHSKPSN